MGSKIFPRNVKRTFGRPRRRGMVNIQNYFRNMILGCGQGFRSCACFWEHDNEPSGSTPWHNSSPAKPSLASSQRFYAWFQASAEKYMRTALFRAVIQRVVVIPYWRIGTAYRSHFKEFSFWILDPWRWDR